MPVRTSTASCSGDLRHGSGHMTIGDGLFQGTYSFASRFQEGGTNPEELLAAAHAGCYAMALSDAGYEPDGVDVVADVHLEDGDIARIHLDVDAEVPDVDEELFQEAAMEAKETCPVSRALAAVPEVTMDATLG